VDLTRPKIFVLTSACFGPPTSASAHAVKSGEQHELLEILPASCKELPFITDVVVELML
jgi:hypothetical protein